MVVCVNCEEEVKDKARLGHFYIPALVFFVLNIAIFLPFLLSNLKDMQAKCEKTMEIMDR